LGVLARAAATLVPNGRSLFLSTMRMDALRRASMGKGKLLRGGNCTCTPLLASFVAACSSPLTAFVSPVTSLLTLRHANGQSFSIGNY